MPFDLRVHRIGFAICALALALVAGPARAQEATHKVRMYWNFGSIGVELYGNETPRHVANFFLYADRDDYDGSFVHRTRAGAARFIQGGGFYVPANVGPDNLTSDPIESDRFVINEFDASSGLSNTPHSLAAARTGDPDSATNQWFFNVTDNATAFDSGPYTVFGEVTDGWDWFQSVPNQYLLQDLFSETMGSYASTTPLVNVGTETDPSWTLVVLAEVTRAPLVPGDFNLDGLVDAADEDVWAAAEGSNLWEQTSGDVFDLTPDANGDAVVDMADHAIWEENVGEGALTPQVAGDYNGDGQVTIADYGFWHATYGQGTTLFADGNEDGMVDMADYTIWRDAFAAAGGQVAGGVAVPEPASGALCASLVAAAAARGRPRRTA